MAQQARLYSNKYFIAALAFIIFVLTTLLARQLRGQLADFDLSRPAIQQAGQLFVLRFAPNAPQFEVLTTGVPVMKMTPDKVEVLGRQFDLSGRRREFTIRWCSGRYQILDPIDSTMKLEIQVIDKNTERSETFELAPLFLN